MRTVTVTAEAGGVSVTTWRLSGSAALVAAACSKLVQMALRLADTILELLYQVRRSSIGTTGNLPCLLLVF